MREIMSRSQLPDLYEQLLSHHMAGDDLRRSTESKLLHYQYDLLLAWPDPFIGPPDSAISEEVRSLAERTARISASEKDRLHAKLLEIANGMTTLRLTNELAWTIVLEWRDMQSPSDYDKYQLKRYMDIFPDASLTRLAVAVLQLPDPLLEDEKEKREMTIDERAEIVDVSYMRDVLGSTAENPLCRPSSKIRQSCLLKRTLWLHRFTWGRKTMI